MNKAKKYYVDNDGNMIHSTRYKDKLKEMKPTPFHAKLKIVGIFYLNYGLGFELQDEGGKIYVMNDVMFSEYLEQQDIFIEGDWNFYQQGTSYSIGL